MQELYDCLADARCNCRVRCEAAAALGAAPAARGLPLLIDFVHAACYDPSSGMVAPLNFSDIGGYLTTQAALAALGAVRAADGGSPVDAIMLLLEVLRQNDNTGNGFSDAHYVATLLEALGNARPRKAAALAAIAEQLDR